MRWLLVFLASPVVMRRFNGYATVVWIVMIPISLWQHWLSSVTYVAVLSIWALVASHLSGWQTAMVAVHQVGDADVQDVMDKMDEA